MSFIRRTVHAARRSDKRAWLAGLALLGAYGLTNALDRGEPPPARPEKQEKRIPPSGWGFWKHVLGKTYAEYNEDRLLLLAAAVAFYAVLALVPAITAAVSIYALFANPDTVQSQLSNLQGLMTGSSFDLIKQQVQRIASDQSGTVGIWFAFGVVVALWSASSGMKGLMDSLNVIYGVDEKRSMLNYYLTALALTLAAIVWLACAAVALVGVPLVLDHLPLGTFGKSLANWVRWPALLAILMVGLAGLYRFGPDREHPRWEWVSPGNLLGGAGWLIGSGLLSWYLSNFANYNATYGSLGAAVALMLWLWITAIMILLGAELNSEYYKAKEASHGRGGADRHSHRAPLAERAREAAERRREAA